MLPCSKCSTYVHMLYSNGYCYWLQLSQVHVQLNCCLLGISHLDPLGTPSPMWCC